MRVGVIASELEGRTTGVGRYLAGLLQGLTAWEHGTEWHLFFQGEPFESRLFENDFVHPHFSNGAGSSVLWEQLSLSRVLPKMNLDVVFGPAYSLPYRVTSPSIVTLHDLSFELLPLEFRFKERWRRRLFARRAARQASRILTDTRAMADLVSDRYDVHRQKIGVVPLGIDTSGFSRRPEPDDDRQRKELGISFPYVLWVGSLFERRLPSVVLDAFSALRTTRPDLRLVIAGANRLRRPELFDELVEAADLKEAVFMTGWVPESALAPLYRGAELGIYISKHEGFGIPPLECLACGTPVIVSPGLGLDDAWPDYPYRTNRLDYSEIAALMDELLVDRQGVGRALEEALAVLASMSWEKSSRLFLGEAFEIAAS